ncbi:DNA directed RNA polymerase subunit delta [Spiroplasma clarkii]|uniref:RNAP delta factor n=1 Tax=Spiroplasma clarkii TaxID=2139 RepID=A0A1Y0KYQ5_9MOLU|nr:DNA-directed RNA polymerase subunit delta [Spiroplasma clarkii]ARU90866.1 DNA directed RNA polymerase subunit delta [Spiroplasma clarkii]ATX71652.1 DNA directed RNA polymerase subunit delta [Spiroplasma clarkii]
MAQISTIEMAYNFLRTTHGDASFEDIWNAISKDIHGSNHRKNEIIAELYSDLVLDNRFALTAEGKWGLRDYLKFDDIKKQYDYIDKFDTTEEFSDLDNTQALDPDSFDEDEDEDDDDDYDSLDDFEVDIDEDFDD